MSEPKQEWEYYNPFFFSSVENYDDESCYFEWNGYKYSEFLSDMSPDSIYFEDLNMSK